MKVLPFTIPVPHDRTIIVLEEFLPHFYTHLHRHAEIQITLIKKGEGTLLAGNSMHPFQDNEIYFLGPNQPHLFKSDTDYFVPESEKQVETITIFFNPSGQLSALFNLPEMTGLKAFLVQSQNGFKIADECFDEVAAKIEQINLASGAIQLSLFIDLLNTMAEQKCQPLSSEGYTYSMTDPEGLRIASVYNYIMNNFSTSITLEDAARQAHLTPTAFCRYFKKHTRYTFVNFVNKIRVNEACRLLVNGAMPSIATIAYHCGFNSITNFNYVFKSVTGISPREYVNSYSKTIE